MELDLNQAKEKVQSLPETIESDWYHNFRQFKFTNKEGKQIKEIIAYFDMSFKYSERFSSEAIVPYSISKIAAKNPGHESRRHVPGWKPIMGTVK